MRDETRSRDTFGLAGWLFADLMLALAVLFFASNTFGETPPATPAATPTAVLAATPLATPMATLAPKPTPTATPTPTPTPPPTAAPTALSTPCETTVVLKKHELSVTDPTPDKLQATFAPFQGQVAGLVLAYGHAPVQNFSAGETLANRTNDMLRAALPDMFRSTTLMEAYHFIDPSGAPTVDFSVYFLTNQCG